MNISADEIADPWLRETRLRRMLHDLGFKTYVDSVIRYTSSLRDGTAERYTDQRPYRRRLAVASWLAVGVTDPQAISEHLAAERLPERYCWLRDIVTREAHWTQPWGPGRTSESWRLWAVRTVRADMRYLLILHVAQRYRRHLADALGYEVVGEDRELYELAEAAGL